MAENRNEMEQSQAMTLLTHFWECGRRVKPFSEARFRATLKDALELAIIGGLKFDTDDCSRFHDNFSWGAGYYKEQLLSFGESSYALAIIASNMSACHSFEKSHNRKPFIIYKVDHNYRMLRSMPGRWDITRPRDRLGVGSKFTWQGKRVTVTSFDDKNGLVIACAYKPREREASCPSCGRGGWETGTLKVEHIYKLTNKELKGERCTR